MEQESLSLQAQQRTQLQELLKDYDYCWKLRRPIHCQLSQKERCPTFTWKDIESRIYVLSLTPIAGSPIFSSFPSLLVLHAEILSFGSKMLFTLTRFLAMPNTACLEFLENLARLKILLSQTKFSVSYQDTWNLHSQRHLDPRLPRLRGTL